jgi:DNA-binding NarL/FixJ family response regulator
MSPVVAKKVLQLLTLQKQFAVKPSETFDLTPREKEILAQMVNGLSYKMIAAKLDIGFETVRSHISSIYKKLHVATMTEAVAKAIKSNLV